MTISYGEPVPRKIDTLESIGRGRSDMTNCGGKFLKAVMAKLSERVKATKGKP